MTPARYSKKCLISKSPDLFMDDRISIFDFSKSESSDKIYLRGINNILKEIFLHLGGVKEVSLLLNQKYAKVKEWPMGRKPISLLDLNSLLGECDKEFVGNIKAKIDNVDIYLNCKYSPKRIKFPKYLSENLSYLAGLILGDGSLAGDSSNLEGNWNISAYFDNLEHHKIYDNLIFKEFEVSANFKDPDGEYTTSIFSSRVLHWFFREYFGFFNGYKCSKIFVPNKILDCENRFIIIAFLQGLFDSDGTFTCGEVRYSTTSEKMAVQVKQILLDIFGIDTSLGIWRKKGEYLPLYTVYLHSRAKVESFAELIGFRHPNKKVLLENFINSPIV